MVVTQSAFVGNLISVCVASYYRLNFTHILVSSYL